MRGIIEKLGEFTGDSLTERSTTKGRKPAVLMDALEDAAKEWMGNAVREVGIELPGMVLTGKGTGPLMTKVGLELYKDGEKVEIDATVKGAPLINSGGMSGTEFTVTLEGAGSKKFKLAATKRIYDIMDDIEKFFKSKGYTSSP